MSYIGAQRVFSEYSEMGDAKALLESIVRSFGYRLGAARHPHQRGLAEPDQDDGRRRHRRASTPCSTSPRRWPRSATPTPRRCADYCVTLLSDYTRMVTMQTLYHDGGFSAMGISDALVEGLSGMKIREDPA